MTTAASGGFAAAYLRRSSADDENPGIDSRGRQEAAIRKLCGENLVEYVDWGISGSGDGSKRPEYQRLKADIAAGQVKSVCAESISRLGRSTVEFLQFMELCRQHEVKVQTADEGPLNHGPAGEFMYTILAAFGKMEHAVGVERSAGARVARFKRHEAAGALLANGKMPPSIAIYGTRHRTQDGITTVEDDPDRPIEPVLAAYREAGTIRGACELLNKRSVPGPRGKGWGVSTLQRVLAHYAKPENGALVELPEVMSRTAGRRPVSARALFAGLLRCHCGATMTPNVSRKDRKSGRPMPVQYYCGRGRDHGAAQHGPYTVAEAAIRRVLEPPVNDLGNLYNLEFRHAEKTDGKQRAKLERRRQVILDQEYDLMIGHAEAKAKVADVDAQLTDLDRKARSGTFLRLERLPSWDDVPAMNRHLRHVLYPVQLDATMAPVLPLPWIVTPPEEQAETPEEREREEALQDAYYARKVAKE